MRVRGAIAVWELHMNYIRNTLKRNGCCYLDGATHGGADTGGDGDAGRCS